MRARIPKQRKVSADSNDFIIELGKPMAQIDEKVQRQYEELIKENGEERRLDIIVYMQTEKFINLFSPGTPPIRKRISESVSRLAEQTVLDDLEKTVDMMQKKYNFTLEKIVEKMKSEKFALKWKGFYPDSLASIAEKVCKKFVEQKEEKLKKVSHLTKNQQRDTKSEKSTGMTIEDERFLEQVKSFTNGFNFLARDLLIHISETGRRNIGQFDKLDDYIKFTQIQEKVRQEMGLLKTDESSAIKSILKKSNGRLNNVDFYILNARMQKLDKKRNSIGLPDEQEM